MQSGALTFGRWVRQQRKARDLTQEELADRVACSFNMVRHIEAGRRRASRQLARLIAEYLGATGEQLETLVTMARAGVVEVEPGLPQPAVRAQNNLPAWRTNFIGREFEIGEVAALIQRPDVRLLTLIGPAGIGKTRLALETAGRLTGEFDGGVFWVPLSPVTDAALVAPTIARTLGIKEETSRPALEQLKDYLSDREMLLLLDNFEQVMAAGQDVAELLEGCRGLKVMVTSRSALHVYGEHEYQVPPMQMPAEEEAIPPPEEVERYEAVDLFAQRARAVKPGFKVTEANRRSVVGICRRLDALPLAIELAAARTKLLTPEAIYRHIDRTLDLLTVGMRDLPPRQQSLRGAIAWSYNLLEQPARALLRAMSVFVGGSTMEAAEEVYRGLVMATWGKAVLGEQGALAAEGGSDGPLGVLDLVGTLVDQSLLRLDEDDEEMEPRLRMLWTIRQFAEERLSKSGEEEAARASHAGYFMRLAERAEPHLTTPERWPWLARLDDERYNVERALEWCRSAGGDRELGLRIAGAMGWYWSFRSQLNKGMEMLEGALEVAGEELMNTVHGAKALLAVGRLASRRRELYGSRDLLRRALATGRRLGDRQTVAYAAVELGAIVSILGDHDEGRALVNEGLELFRESGDRWGLAYGLDYLADVETQADPEPGPERLDAKQALELRKESLRVYRSINDDWGVAQELWAVGITTMHNGDLPTAIAYLREAVPLQERLGDDWNLANTLYGLGYAMLMSGDYEGALPIWARALELCEDHGWRVSTIGPLRYLGYVALKQGDVARAGSLLMESVRMASRQELKVHMVNGLATLAAVAGAQGRLEQTAVMSGAAEMLSATARIHVHPVEWAAAEAAVAKAREALGEEAFEAARARGAAMDVEGIVEYMERELAEE